MYTSKAKVISLISSVSLLVSHASAQIPATWNQTSGQEGVHVPGTIPHNPYEPLEMRSAFASPTAVTVSWNTFIKLDNPTVQYGEDPLDLDQTASSDLSFTYATSRTFNNHVLLTDLKPGTEYHYKVQHLNCNDCAYRTLGTFRTPRAAGDMTPYSAAFVADLGTMGPSGLSDTSIGVALGPNETNCIQSMLEGVDSYEWAAHWGDFAYADYFLQMLDYGTFGEAASEIVPTAQQIADAYESITETFYDDLEPITSRRTYMAAPGNHEASCNGGKGEVAGVSFNKSICMEGQTNFTGYRNHWRMPDGNTQGALGNFWYSFDYGMAHFAVINTETDFDEAPAEGGRLDSGPFGLDGQQLAWLEKDLGDVDRSKTPWVIVAGHRPYYVSGVNGTLNSCIPCMAAFEPILLKHNVDLMMTGHVHAYDRSWPVANNGTLLEKSYDNPKYPVYITNGAGGHWDGLDNLNYQDNFSAKLINGVYGWSRINFHNATHLTYEYIASANGTVMDSLTLHKKRNAVKSLELV